MGFRRVVRVPRVLLGRDDVCSPPRFGENTALEWFEATLTDWLTSEVVAGIVLNRICCGAGAKGSRQQHAANTAKPVYSYCHQ
jgi:hypothetical protein